MSNDDAFRSLQELINRSKEMGNAAEAIAPEVAKALESELHDNISKGVGPDGEAWQKTQEGEVPLRNAAKALDVKADGSVVMAILTGPEARHHLGTAKGQIKRRILPSGRRIPQKTVEAIRSAFFKKCRGE